MSAEQTISLPKSAVELAAWICECYAEFIRADVMSQDIERHPYVPQIEGCAEDLREAIEAHAETPAIGAPAGFKLVPIEPTEAMLAAGQDAQNRACYQKPKPVGAEWGAVYYRAMLDAAPGEPGQEAAAADAKDAARYRWLRERPLDWSVEHHRNGWSTCYGRNELDAAIDVARGASQPPGAATPKGGAHD